MPTESNTPAPAPAQSTSAAATSESTTPGVTFAAPSNGSADGNGNPSENTNATPWAGLSAENLEIVKNKNWSDLNAAIKSYSDLEKAFGQKSAAAPAAPADISAYDFGKPADLPAGVHYDDAFLGKFKEWAFEHKAPVEIAKGIHDKFVKFAADAATAANEQLTQSIAKTKSELNTAWGPDGTPNFNRQLELSVRAADKLGISDELKAIGATIDVGGKTVIANAKVAMALAKVGDAMYAEDSIHGTAASSINPFDPKTENQTLAGQIYKQDPQKAKALIYAAGQQEKFAGLLATIK